MGHSRLSPSKSARVLVCPASANREAQLPDSPGGEAANQGTNAHWLLEQAIIEDRWPPKCVGDGGNDLLSQLPYTVDGLPHDLRDQAHDCYFYAKKRQEELGEGTKLEAESEVSPQLYTGRTDSDGTVDISLVAADFLEIVDLKTGGGLVEADASQLRLYALGKMAEYADPETGAVPFNKVRLTVYQPKRPGVDTVERFVELTPSELIEWAHSVWVPAAAESDNPNAVGKPTEDGCKYCKAKKAGTCPEYKAALKGAAEIMFQPVGTAVTNGEVQPLFSAEDGVSTMDPFESSFAVDDMTPEQVAAFLEVWPLIKARGKDIEERGFQMLKDRQAVPGFKLVVGQNRRAWAHDEEEMKKKLKNMKLTLDQAQPRKLATPAQLMNSDLPAKMKEKVKKHIVTKSGGLALVPANDKRVDAMPAVEFQPVQVVQEPAPAPAETPAAPAVDLDFLGL